jgi:hypothetical protein
MTDGGGWRQITDGGEWGDDKSYHYNNNNNKNLRCIQKVDPGLTLLQNFVFNSKKMIIIHRELIYD